ncbi:LysR family transcriptional regulator [Herbaspirillum sp. YR522]|uniref:LysR family transcriptional regulator n=1 Tax=Herbaspirillum sp. YR522 TaxID=1144342 RepID=UPI00026F6E21|nr:LysR family transcriptional regulator [Herbaspirillum sp. YR522]EJN01457.1 transcriptional regulator [Herbaspirillum sp. YR522]
MNTTKRLDLNLLLTLETLLAERNVSRAADRLCLSQPAVSSQLNRLRTLFDDALLVPGHRAMMPTAKALTLREPLRQALDQVRATLAEHRHFDPKTARLTVSIACTDYLQKVIVQPLLVALRKQAPGVRIALRHLDVAQLEAQMASGEVDLALMSPEHAPASLRTRHLFDEHYVLIGRQRHPRLRRKLSVPQFAALDQVIVSLHGSDFSTPVDDALAALGYRRNVVVSASSFLLLPDMVAHSDLVALVPARLVRECGVPLRIVPCPLAVPGFGVAMLWHEHDHGHAGQRWVRDFVAELASRL